MTISQHNFELLLRKYGAEKLQQMIGLENSDLKAYENQIKEKLDPPIAVQELLYDCPPCAKCGSQKQTRNGTCFLCLTCGQTTGCG